MQWNYSRKVQRTLNLYTNDMSYVIDMPGRRRDFIGRSSLQVPMYCAQELLEEDVMGDIELRSKLVEMIAANQLPRCYYEHPVVVKYGHAEPILPISISVDGLPYSQTDSVCGFWFINMITGARYLVCALRKVITCRCGCRGWCSFHAVFKAIAWMAESLANKLFPRNRHDNKPRRDDDIERSQLAGKALTFRCCLTYIKTDWTELSTFGIPLWQDGYRP